LCFAILYYGSRDELKSCNKIEIRKEESEMKKKLGTILLALILLATLAACGSSTPTPALDVETVAFETYTGIMQRLSLEDKETGAFDIDFVMEMDMSFLGEEIHSVSNGNMQMIVDGDHLQLAMTMETDMSALGLPPMVMEMYMVVEDDSLTELRMIVDGDDVSEIFPTEMLEDMADDMFGDAISMPEFDMDAFQSVEIEEVDGNTVIHMVLDGEELSEFVSAAMDDQLAMLDGFGVEMHIEIADILMSVTVDENENPVYMTMEMEMRMGFGDDLADELAELGGEEMVIRMVTVYTFNGFDDSVEITLV